MTTCFSQSSPAHLLNNCLGLYFVSGAALRYVLQITHEPSSSSSVLGGFGFLSLYLAGGVAASLASLGWQAVQRNPNNRGSQGASGAIYATLSFFAMVFPQSQILLFFVIPMPAWVAVAGFMAVSRRDGLARHLTRTTVGYVLGHLASIVDDRLRRTHRRALVRPGGGGGFPQRTSAPHLCPAGLVLSMMATLCRCMLQSDASTPSCGHITRTAKATTTTIIDSY